MYKVFCLLVIIACGMKNGDRRNEKIDPLRDFDLDGKDNLTELQEGSDPFLYMGFKEKRLGLRSAKLRMLFSRAADEKLKEFAFPPVEQSQRVFMDYLFKQASMSRSDFDDRRELLSKPDYNYWFRSALGCFSAEALQLINESLPGYKLRHSEISLEVEGGENFGKNSFFLFDYEDSERIFLLRKRDSNYRSHSLKLSQRHFEKGFCILYSTKSQQYFEKLKNLQKVISFDGKNYRRDLVYPSIYTQEQTLKRLRLGEMEFGVKNKKEWLMVKKSFNWNSLSEETELPYEQGHNWLRFYAREGDELTVIDELKLSIDNAPVHVSYGKGFCEERGRRAEDTRSCDARKVCALYQRPVRVSHPAFEDIKIPDYNLSLKGKELIPYYKAYSHILYKFKVTKEMLGDKKYLELSFKERSSEKRKFDSLYYTYSIPSPHSWRRQGCLENSSIHSKYSSQLILSHRFKVIKHSL